MLPVYSCEGTICQCGSETCQDVGKHPHRELAPNGLLNATTDTAIIEEWFRRYPNINVGIALSASGLVALDVDAYKGDKERLDALEALYGALPDTHIQLSGSQEGYHILFNAPSHAIKGALGGITMRGRNYIVVSPSVHKSGGQYTWVAHDTIGSLPEAWTAALLRDTSVDNSGVPDTDSDWLESIAHDTRLATGIAYLQEQPGEVYQVSPPATTWNVVRSFVRGFAIRDADAVYQALQEHYNNRCVPPWPDDKLAYKVTKAYREATQPEWGEHVKPIDVSLNELGFSLSSAADTDTIAPELMHDSALIEQAFQDITKWLGNDTGGTGIRLLFEPASELFDRVFPDTVWLVQGLIGDGGIAGIATEPKAAKTWAATEIALAIATGTPAFNEYPTQRGRVAYFYAEDMGVSIRNRLRSLAKSRGLCPKEATRDLHVQPRGRNIDITKVGELALIVASCRKIGPIKLLVLDPLRDIHTGEENSADSMAPVMKHLKCLGAILQCTVMFVHHSNKGAGDGKPVKRGQNRMRGSNVIGGALDSGLFFNGLTGNGVDQFTNSVESVVKLARSAGYFTLTLDITDDMSGAAIDCKWTVSHGDPKPVAGGHRADALEVKVTEVVDVLGVSAKPMSTRELGAKVKGGNTILCAATLECEKRGFITHPVGRAHGWVLTESGKRFFQGLTVAPSLSDDGGVADGFLK